MVFAKEKEKKFFATKTNSSFPETLQITLYLQTNEQYGQTTKK